MSVFFDFWPLVHGVREGGSAGIVWRATAQAAGRRATRSPWRKRWRLTPDQRALWPHSEHTPEVEAYQALWRGLRHHEGISPDLAWYRVRQVLRSGDFDAEDIEDAIKESLGTAESAT